MDKRTFEVLPDFVWPTVGHPGRVPLWALKGNPKQPRKHFGTVDLKALAETMKKKNGGEQREIITVRELTAEELIKFAPARYLIISGERRARAAELAGLEDVEIRVKEYKSLGFQKLDAYMLNNNRVHLSDIENADAIVDLMEEFGWTTQEEVARHIGEDQSWVAQHLALLKLSPQSRKFMDPSLPENVRVKRGVGVFLSKLSHETQDALTPGMPIGERVTASQQVAYLASQVKGTDEEPEANQLQPSTLRRIINYHSNQVERRTKELRGKKGIERLFDNATEAQRLDLLGRLRDAQGELSDFIDYAQGLLPEEPKQKGTVAPGAVAAVIARSLVLGAGKNEKTVTFFSEHSGRMVTDKVTKDQYLQLYGKGHLKFQREGKERPIWMPTPEGAEEDWKNYCD